MNTVKEVVLSIAQELKEHPERWCQYAYYLSDGKACLAAHVYNRTKADTELSIKVNDHIRVEIGQSMEGWNDQHGRTVEEVIALCEKVAQNE